MPIISSTDNHRKQSGSETSSSVQLDSLARGRTDPIGGNENDAIDFNNKVCVFTFRSYDVSSSAVGFFFVLKLGMNYDGSPFRRLLRDAARSLAICAGCIVPLNWLSSDVISFFVELNYSFLIWTFFYKTNLYLYLRDSEYLLQ